MYILQAINSSSFSSTAPVRSHNNYRWQAWQKSMINVSSSLPNCHLGLSHYKLWRSFKKESTLHYQWHGIINPFLCTSSQNIKWICCARVPKYLHENMHYTNTTVEVRKYKGHSVLWNSAITKTFPFSDSFPIILSRLVHTCLSLPVLRRSTCK